MKTPKLNKMIETYQKKLTNLNNRIELGYGNPITLKLKRYYIEMILFLKSDPIQVRINSIKKAEEDLKELDNLSS